MNDSLEVIHYGGEKRTVLIRKNTNIGFWVEWGAQTLLYEIRVWGKHPGIMRTPKHTFGYWKLVDLEGARELHRRLVGDVRNEQQKRRYEFFARRNQK